MSCGKPAWNCCILADSTLEQVCSSKSLEYTLIKESFSEVFSRILPESGTDNGYYGLIYPGQDIHMHETRGRDDYRTERHRTVVYEHLRSQAGDNFLNRQLNSIKNDEPFVLSVFVLRNRLFLDPLRRTWLQV
ncbi:hypothetical protein J6590_077948 [Homalodisca vitripennis]|nr:hypothetical protein J6590_077948 [Homalodisca vitripennis]